MGWMKPDLWRIVLIAVAIFTLAAVPQQELPQLHDITVAYTYAGVIEFQARMDPAQAVEKVFLCVEPAGQPVETFEVLASPEGEIHYTLETNRIALRAFGRITYWFRLERGSLNTTSDKYHFYYEDNRQVWQTISTDQFLIHWLDGDASFGQAALNVAQSSFSTLKDKLQITPPLPLRIYIYPTPQEMQQALQLTSTPWVAAHADPDLGVLVLSAAAISGYQLEFEQQIPHELAHIFLFQSVGTHYQDLPTWLSEGIASQAELNPNAEYTRVVSTAASSGNLINFETLCTGFPMDASGAFLSYAQSSSLAAYISNTYGQSGLQNLIGQYRDGKGCSEGVQAGLGVSLAQLQNDWQQETLGTSTNSQVWAKLRPFVLVGSFILLPPIFLGLFTRLKKN